MKLIDLLNKYIAKEYHGVVYVRFGTNRGYYDWPHIPGTDIDLTKWDSVIFEIPLKGEPNASEH